MAVIDFGSDYYLAGIAAELAPPATFFRDRYFGESEVFPAEKILIEFMDGDRRMAPFVAPRAGDIPVERGGYEIHEFIPPMIAPSRLLTADQLMRRGFGEPLQSGTDAAARAQALQVRDLQDLTARITRREEWMAAQTMINNGIDVVEYIDENTRGQALPIRYYDIAGANPGAYTGTIWADYATMQSDVEAMCDMLTERGLPAEDLVLGSDAWTAIRQFSDLRELLDIKHMYAGEINARIIAPGVTHAGTLNINGYNLNVLIAKEQCTDENGRVQRYFPAKSALVTAPNCGKRYYGSIVQIPHGGTEFEVFTQERVAKLIVDDEKDIRKFRLASRPLTAPKHKAPWVYAANVVS